MSLTSNAADLVRIVLPSSAKRYLKDRLFPRRISVHNSVAVRGVIPPFEKKDHYPDYEEYLVGAIRRHVEQGDAVTLAGGGYGVSTVIAAQKVRPNGQVHTYEASEDYFKTVKETVKLNQVTDYVSVNHAIAADYHDESEAVYGDSGDASLLAASELRDCDVLVLDCEGAERNVLDKRDLSRPRVIIVETHGYLGSPEEVIENLLKDAGYQIVAREVEHEANGVSILTAVQQ